MCVGPVFHMYNDIVFCVFQRVHRGVTLDQKPATSTKQPALLGFVHPQPSLSQKKWAKVDSRQQLFTRSLVSVFASNPYVPLSLLDNPEFRQLLTDMQPGFNIPSRKTLTSSLLPERQALIHNNIKHLLQSAISVCLTIDLWSNRRMRSFIGITGHCIID